MIKKSKVKVKLMTPLPYQLTIIKSLENNEIRYVTATVSRRCGKSFLAQNIVLKWCLERHNTRVGYICPISSLCREFIREIKKALNGVNIIKTINATDLFIEFVNGSVVQFLSAESFQRGKGKFKKLIVDEAAFISDEKYNQVFKPLELEADKIFYISTPNSSSGFFYENFIKGLDNNNKRYISHKTNIYEANLYDKEIIQEIKETTNSIIFNQEFMCEFISSGISCFGDYRKLCKDSFTSTNNCYAGIDFALDGSDDTVLTIVNDNGEMIYTETFNNPTSSIRARMIGKALSKFAPKKTYAETNSIGSIMLELILNEFKNIDGFTSTNDSKREIVENVMVMFENGKGGLLKNEKLYYQFDNFVTKFTPKTKKITYGNLRDSIHDDCVISYCLAIKAMTDHKQRGSVTMAHIKRK